MLDTNMASLIIIKGHPQVCQQLVKMPMSSLCVSSITHAELMLGVAKKPQATRLPALLQGFFARVETLAFTDSDADVYAQLRSTSEKQDKSPI